MSQTFNKKLLVIKPPFEAFPLGFAYVLSCLEKNNIPFDLIDTSLQSSDYSKLLKKNDYLAVTSGGLIGQFRFFMDIVAQVRGHKPNLPIILGGNIVKDIRPDFICGKMGIDFGLVGEAETCLPQLLGTIKNKTKDYASIPGLVYKDSQNNNVLRNPPKRLNLQLENILPAWKHFNMDYYSKDAYMPFFGRRSVMPILSGRGCVGACSFCSPTVGGFQKRPINHVIEEIDFLNSTYDFEWLVFFNEMFYPSKKEILEFCEAYRKMRVMKPWVCALRVDADVDKDTFVAMKEAGCLSTSAGIESGSDKILKLMRKRSTNEQIRKFFRGTRAAGLPCNGTFMVGNEGETEEDIKKTIDMVIEEEMNTGESLMITYPGTQVYRNALSNGLIANEWDYLQKLNFSIGVFTHSWIDRKDYLNITEIKGNQFWEVIVRELRRYHTFLHNRYQAKNVTFESIIGLEYIRAKGTCIECGNVVTMNIQHQLLGLETYCPHCFNRAYFDFFKQADYTAHHKNLIKGLSGANRLVIVGLNPDAATLLRIDSFNINFGALKGFLDLNNQYPADARFVNMPILQLKDLSRIKPDFILIVDDPKRDVGLQIKLSYIDNKQADLPRMLHLVPTKKSWRLRLVNIIIYYDINQRFIVGAIAHALSIFSIIEKRTGRLLVANRYLRKHGPRMLLTKFISKIRRAKTKT